MLIKKSKIVKDWLPRYTGAQLNELGEYILLTNFYKYLEVFSKIYNSEIKGIDKPMPHTTVNGITIINFNMGSPNAATIIDLLTAINPKACLFLGKCGGLKKKNKIGDWTNRKKVPSPKPRVRTHKQTDGQTKRRTPKIQIYNIDCIYLYITCLCTIDSVLFRAWIWIAQTGRRV